MTDQVDNWQKLAQYDTNLQGELHATLLQNNGIRVSTQALSAIPGMNSGAVLWVQDTDLARAQAILANINTDSGVDSDDFDSEDNDSDDIDFNNVGFESRIDAQGKG
ncbi:hypothetical protein [Psychrobacter aestuarii]|uniref:DUF2007 domain-containing protein n=1 Tax=Psychrobacter aestuarii TaxID=556327 RepID=A0ABN0VJF0_9GAMM|nr:hypothetical protein [Psychrobacter aestuarii]